MDAADPLRSGKRGGERERSLGPRNSAGGYRDMLGAQAQRPATLGSDVAKRATTT